MLALWARSLFLRSFSSAYMPVAVYLVRNARLGSFSLQCSLPCAFGICRARIFPPIRMHNSRVTSAGTIQLPALSAKGLCIPLSHVSLSAHLIVCLPDYWALSHFALCAFLFIAASMSSHPSNPIAVSQLYGNTRQYCCVSSAFPFRE